MESHIPIERQESESPDFKIRSDQAPSNAKQGLLSPSFPQSFNINNEPLIRRPVLPPRLSSKSLEKQLSGATELEQTSLIGPDPLWESLGGKSQTIAPPKAFKKTHRFLGLKLGYWRLPARHFSIFAILMLVTVIPLYFVTTGYVNTLVNYAEPPFYDCNEAPRSWTFVGVNLKFGTFNYGLAKGLDLAWNWIVGRGLQGLLMLLAYRVFTDALLRSVEMTPLSYELYAALSLYSTSLNTLWHLVTAITQKGNRRTKSIFTWLFISTIYLLSFPSLMDACSGYESSYLTYFQWPNGTLNNTDDFFSHGWFDDSTNYPFSTSYACVTWLQNDNNQSARPYNFSFTPIGSNSSDSVYADCYDMQYPGNQKPPDISFESDVWVLFYWHDSTLNTSWWEHFQSDPWTSQWSSWAEWNFYPTDPNNFQCTTQKGIYQWGFSYEWLLVVSIINSTWLLGTWILWVDCDRNSEMCKKGRRLGLWRAIADISEAMREELGPNICAYSEGKLAEALKNKPPIKYYAEDGNSQKPGHIGLSSKSSGRVRLRWDHEYGTQGKLGIRPLSAAPNEVPYSRE